MRKAFTLIELLFAVAILAVLSTLAVGIIGSAQEDARAAATQSRITNIENLLLLQMEDYEVRRLPIRIFGNNTGDETLEKGVENANITNDTRFHIRNLKRRVMADIINAEMPRNRDNIDDGTPNFNDFPTVVNSDGTSGGLNDWLSGNNPNGDDFSQLRGWLSNVSRRPAGAAVWDNLADDVNISAEFLYLILQQN